MAFFNTKVAAVLMAMTLAPTAQAATVNLIDNADFEAGYTDFTSDYANTYLNSGGPGSANLAPHLATASWGSPIQGDRVGDHTTGTGLALFVSGSTESVSSFWKQSVQLTPYTNYAFTVWGTKWANDSIQALTLNGVQLGSFTIDTLKDHWAQYTVRFNSGSVSNGILGLVNLSTEAIGNGFAVDDLSLVPVSPVPLPAPAALLLAGLGSLTLLRRKRA
ncbi:MAG: hypothetical protein ACK5IB_05190 [Qingshengfaniella sp.]